MEWTFIFAFIEKKFTFNQIQLILIPNIFDPSLKTQITQLRKIRYLKFGDGDGPNLCRVKK